MEKIVTITKLADYGIGVKTTTYFKLMYICGDQLVIAVFGLN